MKNIFIRAARELAKIEEDSSDLLKDLEKNSSDLLKEIEKNPSALKPKVSLQKEFVGKNRGEIFCMVYLFMKTGTRIYSGSLSNIIERARQVTPLCHGIIHFYSGKKVSHKSWGLFGRMQGSFLTTSRKPNETFYDLTHINRFAIAENRMKPGHNYYALTKWRNGEQEVIKKYRRLPSTFLRDLNPIILPGNKNRNDRYTMIKKG